MSCNRPSIKLYRIADNGSFVGHHGSSSTTLATNILPQVEQEKEGNHLRIQILVAVSLHIIKLHLVSQVQSANNIVFSINLSIRFNHELQAISYVVL